ncbi:MAG TPA: hypothetical protein VH724_21000 [Candidatus Angelobacter sp.]|nr:hypothetical protein [Candidatus Angelobacter sp.]
MFLSTSKAAYLYGYSLNGRDGQASTTMGVDGLNEFRAVYICFWIGLTILSFIAARKVNLAVLATFTFLMVLLQSLDAFSALPWTGGPIRATSLFSSWNLAPACWAC